MEYTKLGASNLTVSRVCVGCMSFGDRAKKMFDWTLDPDASEAVVRRALDLNINFFDTANTYSLGTSETYLARTLKKLARRDQIVLATKVYFNEGPSLPRGDPARNRRLSPAAWHRLRRSVYHPPLRLYHAH